MTPLGHGAVCFIVLLIIDKSISIELSVGVYLLSFLVTILMDFDRFFTNRRSGLTHSLAPYMIILIPLYFLLPGTYLLAFYVAVFSHLLLDLTYALPLFYPFSSREFGSRYIRCIGPYKEKYKEMANSGNFSLEKMKYYFYSEFMGVIELFLFSLSIFLFYAHVSL